MECWCFDALIEVPCRAINAEIWWSSYQFARLATLVLNETGAIRPGFAEFQGVRPTVALGKFVESRWV